MAGAVVFDQPHLLDNIESHLTYACGVHPIVAHVLGPVVAKFNRYDWGNFERFVLKGWHEQYDTPQEVEEEVAYWADLDAAIAMVWVGDAVMMDVELPAAHQA